MTNQQKNTCIKIFEKQRYTFVMGKRMKCKVTEKQDDINRLYTQHVQLSERPCAIILIGSPGSGKSYCIKQIFRDLKMGSVNQYVYIDSDDIRMNISAYRNMLNGKNVGEICLVNKISEFTKSGK